MRAFLRARIARHTARAEVFASAHIAAALRGDLIACSYFRDQRDQAAHLRDQLQLRMQRLESSSGNSVLHLMSLIAACVLVLIWGAAILLTH